VGRKGSRGGKRRRGNTGAKPGIRISKIGETVHDKKEKREPPVQPVEGDVFTCTAASGGKRKKKSTFQ